MLSVAWLDAIVGVGHVGCGDGGSKVLSRQEALGQHQRACLGYINYKTLASDTYSLTLSIEVDESVPGRHAGSRIISPPHASPRCCRGHFK